MDRELYETEVAIARRDGRLQISYDFTPRKGPEPVKLTYGVESTSSGELHTRLELAPDRHYDFYAMVGPC